MGPISIALTNLAPQLTPTGPLSLDLFGALTEPARAISIAVGLAIALTLCGLAARHDDACTDAGHGKPAPRLRDLAPLPPAA